MIFPEMEHSTSLNHAEITETIHDTSKSALVVNRKLYRAHRQMRLAVLEASKRFEDQQAEHAKEVILAAREESENRRIAQAGLVMRHGHKKQVSSKSIRTLLESYRQQQLALVEKANRSSGRGRRSRKKTVSDMSSMLTSISQEDLSQALTQQPTSPTDSAKISEFQVSIPEDASLSFTSGMADALMDTFGTTVTTAMPLVSPTASTTMGNEDASDVLVIEQVGHERPSTVPGNFRATHDPFSSIGRYGVTLPNDVNPTR
jgi:hypothetical protein